VAALRLSFRGGSVRRVVAEGLRARSVDVLTALDARVGFLSTNHRRAIEDGTETQAAPGCPLREAVAGRGAQGGGAGGDVT
jgi:hypothetical protein